MKAACYVIRGRQQKGQACLLKKVAEFETSLLKTLSPWLNQTRSVFPHRTRVSLEPGLKSFIVWEWVLEKGEQAQICIWYFLIYTIAVRVTIT